MRRMVTFLQKLFARWRALAVAALFPLALAACASWGGPRVIVLSEADFEQLLTRHLPAEQRLFDLFDVRVEHPHVRLLAASNQLSTEFDFIARNPLLGPAWTTHVVLEHGLRYDERDHAVHLDLVRVHQIQTGPGAPQRQAERLAAFVVEQMLDGLAIYRLRPEDLQNAQDHGLTPGSVAVTSRGIEITLAPAQR